MIIRKIKVNNFRSHTNYGLNFDEQTTKIIGENGCGKTSILEAIYETMQGKSFRAVDREIVRHGEDFYRVELEYIDGRRIIVVYQDNQKTFVVEDKKTRRLPKDQKYPIVLFDPDDLNLIGSSPSHKRAYFDRVLTQIIPIYSSNLSRYEKALRQRNELLKQENVSSRDLFPWNIMLAKYGSEISKSRIEFVEEVQKRWEESYQKIAENTDKINIEYLSDLRELNAQNLEARILNILEENYQKDSYLGYTSFGVHRDDYGFYFNQTKADGSASRGEVRSMVIALKFIEAELIKIQTGKQPLILLDDVFSELDDKRQKCLVENFKNHQVILTSVGNGRL